MPPKKQVDKAMQAVREHPNVVGRVVPRNFEAEQSVLGCILLDDNPSILVLGGLKPDDFHAATHQAIFSAMLALATEDAPIDVVTILDKLDKQGEKENVGGAKYLASLTSVVPSSGNYAHYSAIVRKNSTLRKLIGVSQDIMDIAYAGDEDDKALSSAESRIFALAETQDASRFVPIQASAREAMADFEERKRNPKSLSGVPTPFAKLNKTLGGGFQPGDLVLIAARPGQGKTALGMNLISHAAVTKTKKTVTGKPRAFNCAVFSLEMPAKQLAKRLLCSIAGVNMADANSGTLSTDDWRKLISAMGVVNECNIVIDDYSMITPAEILSKCRRQKRASGLDLIMIDYLQLMSGGAKRFDNRQQEVADITRSLKIAAKELGVPIILLSQVNREVDKRADRKPMMSDLRESGAIEQDADIIIFIYRKYDDNTEGVPPDELTKAELLLAKHRNGSTDKIKVKWTRETISFSEDDRLDDLPQSPADPKPKQAGELVEDLKQQAQTDDTAAESAQEELEEAGL